MHTYLTAVSLSSNLFIVTTSIDFEEERSEEPHLIQVGFGDEAVDCDIVAAPTATVRCSVFVNSSSLKATLHELQ